MVPEKFTMQAGRILRFQVHRRRGRITKLGSEVSPFDVELIDHGGGYAHPDVEFLEHVVVNQCQTNILVATALAALRVHLSQEIQPGAIGSLRGSGLFRLGRVFPCPGHIGVCVPNRLIT